MQSFGSKLKEYREQHNITKLALAKGIGTSDAYIRQIENQGYKPPTFLICQKIATYLSLTSSEKNELFELAFLERIESEKEFYEMLKSSIFVKNERKKEVAKETRYTITWHLRKLIYKKLIPIEKEVLSIIDSVAKISNIEIINPKVKEEFVEFEINTNNISLIQKSMHNLLKLSSSKIKNNHTGFSSVPNIWKNNFDITKTNPLKDSINTSKNINLVHTE